MAISDITSRLQNSLAKASSDLIKASTRLASGARINSAKDDAAGLAVVSSLETEVRTSRQASRNSQDGISIASVAEGSLESISNITVRQQELSVQAANGTLSDEQRGTLNAEFQQLEQEKQRIVSTTTFNGVNVFNGSGTTIQVGTGSDVNSQISLPSADTAGLIGSGLDISTAASALGATDSLSNQIQAISGLAGQIGAVTSRINVADSNLNSQAVESEAAASRIRDADIASEVANRTAASIRQNVNTSLLAQAGKLSGDTVLRLLS